MIKLDYTFFDVYYLKKSDQLLWRRCIKCLI